MICNVGRPRFGWLKICSVAASSHILNITVSNYVCYCGLMSGNMLHAMEETEKRK